MFLANEALGQRGHSAVLCADEGTDLNSQLVGFGNGLATEDSCTETTGEGITCTYRVGNSYLWCWLERLLVGCKYIATVRATSEDEDVELVGVNEVMTLLFEVETTQIEHTFDNYQFLIVDFQNIAFLE